jgi:hypothetical protein
MEKTTGYKQLTAIIAEIMESQNYPSLDYAIAGVGYGLPEHRAKL